MTPAEKARFELLGEFRRSTTERVEKINLGWLELEKTADPQVSEEVLRHLHSLKGESRMMGFADVSLVTHRTEDLVLAASQKGFKVPDEVGDLVLAALDTIGSLIGKQAGEIDPTDLSGLMDSFDAAVAELTPNLRPKTIRPPKPRPEKKAFKPKHEVSAASKGQDSFLRVDTAVVSKFAESAGEVVVTYVRHAHVVEGIDRSINEVSEQLLALDRSQVGTGTKRSPQLTHARKILGDLRTRVGAHAQDLYEASLQARDLDFGARNLRMVPISMLFSRYQRSVRDLGREQGKKIDLVFEDNDANLDKIVVEKLFEPLLHMVRNSVDHGLETPSERIAAGKTETGTIKFTAQPGDGYVVITIEDDGRGIDRAVLRQRAIDVGLVSKGKASQLSEEETLALIFRSGFSTRETTTQISGRGLGLNVVRRQVELLDGSVRINSHKGKGTRFELRVPTSISLTRILVVQIGRELIAIPSLAVDGVLAIDESDIEMVHNRRTIRFRGASVPLADLARVLGAKEGLPSERVVVVHHEESRVALTVTHWHSDMDVVVKPIGTLLASSQIAGGACILQGGELAVVLNPSELVARARSEAPRIRLAKGTESEKSKHQSILLVEDSALTRGMIARILAAMGYEITEAEDGIEALEKFEENDITLILTDIDMPRMDGIELIRRVRQTQEFLPILVLSTRGSDADKRLAIDAGADGYLVKTDFSETELREAIRQRLGS